MYQNGTAPSTKETPEEMTRRGAALCRIIRPRHTVGETMTRKLICPLFLSAAIVATAAAAAIPKAQISANAKWVVHLDMDRFAASQTCASLLNDPVRGKAFQSQLAHYRLFLGIEPLEDVRQVTLYGEEISGSRGVALIAGALNPGLFAKRIAGNAQYRSKTAGKLTLHLWRDKNSGANLAACFYTAKLLIVGSDEPALNAALDVLGGSKPSLSDTRQGLPLPASRDGVFFTAVTRSYSGSDENPIRAEILRNTDTATVLIGENKGIAEAGLWLAAVSPDAADRIETYIRSMALAANLADATSELGKLAELGQISRQNKVVNVTLRCKASDAAAALASSIMGR